MAAACGGSTDDPTGDDQATADGTTGELFLQPGFADGLRAPAFLVAGRTQPAPIVITDDLGRPLSLDDTPAEVTLRIVRGEETIDTQTLPVRGDGIPIPHYTPRFALAEPGDHRAVIDLDGTAVSFDFRVADGADTAYLGPGDRLLPAATPTVADPGDVDPICTYLPDPCPFHDRSLDEVVGGGQPVVFLVATPAFCQTSICGPVVDMAIDRLSGRDDVAVVHAEVWRNADVVFNEDGLTDAVQAYDLGHEPVLWVADAGGAVTARLDFAWDNAELDDALASAGI